MYKGESSTESSDVVAATDENFNAPEETVAAETLVAAAHEAEKEEARQEDQTVSEKPSEPAQEAKNKEVKTKTQELSLFG